MHLGSPYAEGYPQLCRCAGQKLLEALEFHRISIALFLIQAGQPASAKNFVLLNIPIITLASTLGRMRAPSLS